MKEGYAQVRRGLDSRGILGVEVGPGRIRPSGFACRPFRAHFPPGGNLPPLYKEGEMQYGDREEFKAGRMRHEICIQFFRLGGNRDGIRVLDITASNQSFAYSVVWNGVGIPDAVLNGVLDRVAVRTTFAATQLYGLASPLPWPD